MKNKSQIKRISIRNTFLITHQVTPKLATVSSNWSQKCLWGSRIQMSGCFLQFDLKNKKKARKEKIGFKMDNGLLGFWAPGLPGSHRHCPAAMHKIVSSAGPECTEMT